MRFQRFFFDVRFIPTPVGSTNRATRSTGLCTVHPHARGEHHFVTGMRDRHLGSSPRPWGALLQLEWHGAIARFIPTPVGSTSCAAVSRLVVSVHPHARGEHLRARWRCCRAAGSSPRPWGARLHALAERVARRFIPTPVGSTWVSGRSRNWYSVHPHARGEHSSPLRACSCAIGSSPRPWGARYPPACMCRYRAVHPHARGEHEGARRSQPPAPGSSPRPWGAPTPFARDRAALRFIPTPVGSTGALARIGVGGAVHPHARGEHRDTNKRVVEDIGSSPRPWGALPAGGGLSEWRRFIPTPVGSTAP